MDQRKKLAPETGGTGTPKGPAALARPEAPERAAAQGRADAEAAEGKASATAQGRASAEAAQDKPDGKPEEAAGRAGAGQRDGAGAAEKAARLREEFLALANGKYKAAYTAEVQRIIDRRFREARDAEKELRALRPLAELLLRRYGIENGDLERLLEAVAGDDPALAARAEKNGVTAEQQRHMEDMERELNRLRRAEILRMREEQARQTTGRWLAEAEALRAGDYPGFDLRAEAQDPDFMRLLHAGVPVRLAYELLHRDELLRDAQRRAASEAEKRLLDDIRAQGMRPRENGAAAQGGFVSRADPRGLSKEDRARIRERVSRGERVVF